MKEDQRNYILVGAFVLSMVAGLILWIGMVSGRSGSTVDYFIRYGSVLGGKEGTQVYFDGYPVGIIEKITYLEDGDPQAFRLDVAVGDQWSIPSDSRARITSSICLSFGSKPAFTSRGVRVRQRSSVAKAALNNGSDSFTLPISARVTAVQKGNSGFSG